MPTQRRNPAPLADDLVPSDAWVLLALIFAGKNASRERIIEAGDYINHAIFTDEELDGGLARLERSGCVTQADEAYSITPKVQEWYEHAPPKRRNVFQELERVSIFLGVQ